jgi:protocatechuate 3,4-dioxygenase beta subunit
MTDDNAPPRTLTRRKTLGLFGAAGLAGLAAAVGCSSSDDNTSTPTTTRSASATTRATSATATATAAATALPTATPGSAVAVNCIAVPALTEGPYFVDELLNRSDIRSDPSGGANAEGTPLAMTIKVYDANCSPLVGAHVDLWHCNADGEYSDVSQNGTVGQRFLRGYQATDSNGEARFTTIYPGWYTGRAVHIHFKIRKYDGSSQTAEFTSQFFFDDDFTDAVYRQAPYSSRGSRDRRNSSDDIYGQSGGATLLTVIPSGDGYRTAFGVIMTA